MQRSHSLRTIANGFWSSFCSITFHHRLTGKQICILQFLLDDNFLLNLFPKSLSSSLCLSRCYLLIKVKEHQNLSHKRNKCISNYNISWCTNSQKEKKNSQRKSRRKIIRSARVFPKILIAGKTIKVEGEEIHKKTGYFFALFSSFLNQNFLWCTEPLWWIQHMKLWIVGKNNINYCLFICINLFMFFDVLKEAWDLNLFHFSKTKASGQITFLKTIFTQQKDKIHFYSCQHNYPYNFSQHIAQHRLISCCHKFIFSSQSEMNQAYIAHWNLNQWTKHTILHSTTTECTASIKKWASDIITYYRNQTKKSSPNRTLTWSFWLTRDL